LEPIATATEVVEWGDVATHIGFPLVLFLLGWLIKQNKDARAQMGKAIETLTIAVNSVQLELQHYRETWIDRREALIDIITAHCQDAQGACRALVEVNLGNLKEGQKNVCEKIDEQKAQRNKKWQQQEALNNKIRSHLNDRKLHNNSK